MSGTERVAQFESVTCGGLVAQEYRYRGELADPVNVLYLRAGPGRWLRCCFDAGVFFCREAAAPEAPPPDPGAESSYALVDLGACYPVAGRRVLAAALAERPPDGGELVLTLDDGSVLALVNAADASRVDYRPGAAAGRW